MNREYLLTGTKIIMRRLFRWDTQQIINCYSRFDSLFYNPVDREFVDNVFLHGEFWGAFVRDTLVACCCYFPMDSGFYRTDKSCEALMDFITRPGECFVMGYVGFDSRNIERFFEADEVQQVCSTVYRACMNICEMQAFRQGFCYAVHCAPLKTTADLSPAFKCGWRLIRMRGLAKLVVHYVFAKAVYPGICMDYSSILTVSLSDTKKVSSLLERGYLAFDIIKNNDGLCLSMAPLIAD